MKKNNNNHDFASAAAFALIFAALTVTARADTKPPNILVIVADDLGELIPVMKSEFESIYVEHI